MASSSMASRRGGPGWPSTICGRWTTARGRPGCWTCVSGWGTGGWPAGAGETIDFELSLLPEGRHRLHVNIDLLVLDAASFTLVFEELAALLRGDTPPAPGAGYDFRSYLAQLREETGDARERAQRHWLGRLDDLPC